MWKVKTKVNNIDIDNQEKEDHSYFHIIRKKTKEKEEEKRTMATRKTRLHIVQGFRSRKNLKLIQMNRLDCTLHAA